MQLATIKGYVTSTIKHSSLNGWRLLIAQPCGQDGVSQGAPQIVLDNFGAAIHQRVLITSDGIEARRMVQNDLSPARWTVLGIVDPERSLSI